MLAGGALDFARLSIAVSVKGRRLPPPPRQRLGRRSLPRPTSARRDPGLAIPGGPGPTSHRAAETLGLDGPGAAAEPSPPALPGGRGWHYQSSSSGAQVTAPKTGLAPCLSSRGCRPRRSCPERRRCPSRRCGSPVVADRVAALREHDPVALVVVGGVTVEQAPSRVSAGWRRRPRRRRSRVPCSQWRG
jgi:hypothetical protein